MFQFVSVVVLPDSKRKVAPGVVFEIVVKVLLPVMYRSPPEL